MEGSSQLPYLLGNLSIFIFEPLPKKDKKSWTSKTGAFILEKNSFHWPRHYFPPWCNGSHDKMTAGDESTSFEFQSDKGDLSTFRKTYRLHSAEDKKNVTITGNGSWTFNRSLKLPESLDCKYDMVFKMDNITVNVPVAVKYHRLSAEELAKVEKEKQEQRQKNEETHKRLLAEQEAPIEGEERRRLLADLQSNSVHSLHKTLIKLSQKKVRDDKEIAEAVKRLLEHSNPVVRSSAERAIVKFAPELGHKIKINRDYSRAGTVNVTGPGATAQTPLPPGLIVAAKRRGPWFRSAKVVKKLDNGQVEVQFCNSDRTETVHWSDIRLAPPEVDQPYVSKQVPARARSGNNPDDENTDTPPPAEKSVL